MALSSLSGDEATKERVTSGDLKHWSSVGMHSIGCDCVFPHVFSMLPQCMFCTHPVHLTIVAYHDFCACQCLIQAGSLVIAVFLVSFFLAFF